MAFLLRLCCCILISAIWLLFYSFKNNNEIFVTNPFGFPRVLHFENYVKAWSEYSVPVYFWNSVFVSAATIIATILFALPFSYAVSRMRWRGKELVRIIVSLGMFIPVQAILIPVAQIVNGLDT